MLENSCMIILIRQSLKERVRESRNRDREREIVFIRGEIVFVVK